MQFSATDNFGNLMVAESAARSDAELHADLAAMVQAVLAHHPVKSPHPAAIKCRTS